MEIPLKIRNEVEDYIRQNNIPAEKQKKIRDMVAEIYIRHAYHPEEPVGVIAAQSLSEPTTQMSLDGSEKIILKHGDAIAIARIGEVVDRMMESFGRHVDGWDIADISGQGVFVPGVTENERIAWARVSAVSRHAAPASLVKIKTASGREIIATDAHSFVTRKGNKIVPVAGKDLVKGDRIPSIKLLPENCMDSIETKIFAQNVSLKKPLPEKLVLDEKLGWVFGIYLSEGNCTPNYVSFSNVDETVIAQLREFSGGLGFTCNEYDNFRGFARGHDTRINSTHLSLLIAKSCGSGAKNKRIPGFAYSAQERFVAGLLRGYFDGDGNVSVSRKAIRVSSNSKELIDGVALLLARFGIFSAKGRGKQFTLSISPKYAKVFRERIGFSVRPKAELLDELCSSPEIQSKDFLDMIGGFENTLYDAAAKLRYPTRYMNNFTKRQKVGRSTLIRYIHLFEKISKEKGIDIRKELAIMKQMAYSDVVWDRIEEISRVAPTSNYVYDLTVDGTQTFTTFDGLITHNTMRTYHFAGAAGIQTILGLPRMMEIFDARKEPKTPTMTVYIEREYQDVEKVKQIAETIKEVNVRDIVKSTIVDITDLLIRCKLDREKMKRHAVEIEKIPDIVKVRDANVEMDGDEVVVRSKKKDISNIYALKYNLMETHVAGIKNITQVIVMKEGVEWVINTLGSNLKKIMEVRGVDATRTTTNNIFEIYHVLGVEAARNAIIKEAKHTIEEQGLGVDVRYIMLLSDLMTAKGDIRAIGRYGIAGQKASVLARAAFEETKKHFIESSVKGEMDEIRETIESIMLNQVAPIGTGAFELTGRIPDILKEKKE